MKNVNTKVFLIGGPPGAGKTTLGSALAAQLGLTSLSIDDLVTAVQSVTTPESHPGLHLMWQTPYYEYFTDTPPDKLIDDAIRQHEAAWPFIQAVIRKHALSCSPIVIDGWHLWPSKVAQLDLESIWSGWVLMSPDILEARERENVAFLENSKDPDRMLKNFLARSLWFNNLYGEQAAEYQMNVLYQTGDSSVEELCRMILADAAKGPV